MLAFWKVKVGTNQAEAQLLAGDLTILQRLLPESEVVRSLDTNRGSALTQEQAKIFVEELTALSEDNLSKERVYLSALHREFGTTSERETVRALRVFLEAEVDFAERSCSPS